MKTLQVTASSKPAAKTIVKTKKKKLRYGSELFLAADDAMLAFDAFKYDYDRLESVLNLYSKVDLKFQVTRAVACTNEQELIATLGKLVSKSVILSDANAKKLLTPSAYKAYTSWIADIKEAIEYLKVRNA